LRRACETPHITQELSAYGAAVPDSKRPPAKPSTKPPAYTRSASVETFLAEARAIAPAVQGRGRLIFALDATMSRQPTWDTAQRLQAEMFEEAGKVGGLDVQLVYFRGFNECRASRWVSETKGLRDLMTGIEVRGGNTQIGKVLSHARREAGKRRVNVLVYVGDALEEPIDGLAAKAGELGLLGLRMFVFQEGRDATVERGFRELARLTGGAYARFDPNAADQLAALLRAAAVYAAGGRKALERSGGSRILLEQLK
jgi:hypothetical protein